MRAIWALLIALPLWAFWLLPLWCFRQVRFDGWQGWRARFVVRPGSWYAKRAERGRAKAQKRDGFAVKSRTGSSWGMPGGPLGALLLYQVVTAGAGGQPPIRSMHWTDTQIEGKDRTRRVQNFSNFRLPSGVWAASSPDILEDSSPPPDWSGQYEFTHANLWSALQTFVGDSTDQGNTALWGMRLSSAPGTWLNIKAVAVDNAAAPVVDRPNRTATWVDLWDFCDLRLTLAPGRVVKEVVLKQAGHQPAFRFALRYPAGCSHSVSGDSLRVFSQGGEVFHSSPAWGVDAVGNPVRVSLIAAPDITVGARTFPTVRVVPNPADLAAAVYPVTIDPTIQVSGTTDTEDNWVDSNNANYNQGSDGFVRIRASGAVRKGLLRIATGAIPAGTITLANLSFYIVTGSGTFAVEMRQITDANTWVEGTIAGVPGSAQTGSSCWAYAKYATQAWLGSAGCSTSGVDFDATPIASLTSTWTPVNVWKTWSVTTSVLEGWRDGARVNNGMTMFPAAAGGTTLLQFYSSETGTANKPYWDITYSTSAPRYYAQLLERVRV